MPNKIEKLVNYGRIIKSINLHRTQMNMTIGEACKTCNITERQFYNLQKYFNDNKHNLEDVLDLKPPNLNGGTRKQKLIASNINVVLTKSEQNPGLKKNNEEHKIEKRNKSKTKQEQKHKFDEMLKLAESKLIQ